MEKISVLAIVAWVIFGMLPITGCAQQASLVINGKSFHLDSRYDWNEHNAGLGLEYEVAMSPRWMLKTSVSKFEDSNRNDSYMSGIGLSRRFMGTERFNDFYVDAGLVAFVMSRESRREKTVIPGILPALSMGNRHFGLNLTYIPKFASRKMSHAHRYDPGMGGIFFLQAKLSMRLLTPH